jgi:cell division protein FtsB
VPPSSPAARCMASELPRGVRRIFWAAVAAGGLLFAVQGGEFGTTDLWRQRSERARVTRGIDSLQHVVDSLNTYSRKVQRDPATQERIAREVFGMVRGSKELLYRFTSPRDSTKK